MNTPTVDSGDWDAAAPSSRLRRRPGLALLVVVGVLVLMAAVVVWFGLDRSGDASRIGAGVTPPPCADPGSRETVGPEPWVAYHFQVPHCFRSAEGLLESDGAGPTTRVVVLPVEVTAEPGEPVGAQITVTAADIGTDAQESDDEVEEQLRRGLGGSRIDETARRVIDGARGWGFRLGGQSQVARVVWAFVKGTTQINVICRWFDRDLDARMLAGCNQVVDSLSIA